MHAATDLGPRAANARLIDQIHRRWRPARPLLLMLAVLACAAVTSVPAGTGRLETAAVMAPLRIAPEGMADFERLLAEAKAAGADTVTVDVWWGLVEGAGDQAFDWAHYDDLFARIRAAGLGIVPILSFHKCGGGPGDTCDEPLPDWLWRLFAEEGVPETALKLESETGRVQDDAVAPWATANPAVLAQYEELMAAFRERFGSIADAFVEINISLGPTGELRYPAYNGADGWQYPQRGHFQAYSDVAQQDFRDWALGNFGGLAGVNRRWGLQLSDPAEIRVPGGELPDDSGARAETFIRDNDHVDTQYGRDFIDWYHGSLLAHGARVLDAAHRSLDGPMAEVPLGMKLPGVHWQMKCTERPRIAEITAGLVPTTLDLAADPSARGDAYGYAHTLNMIRDLKQETGREIVLHFTALEMDNDPYCSTGGDGNTSMAEALVFWISQGAADRGIVHKGENALACVATFDDDRSWAGIRNAFAHAPYSGFTFLRLTDAEQGACRPWNGADRAAFRSFVDDFGAGQTLTVHLREWEPCVEDDGCRYALHAFDGLSGDFPLAYQGEIDGAHWWRGEIPDAPAVFGFTFNNSNGWEGGPGAFDRQYRRAEHGNVIYLLGRGDRAIRTSRP